MEQNRLSEMMIEEVLRRWPETAVVFHKAAMVCVGCPLIPFCTVAKVSQIYEIPVETFIASLMQIIPLDEINQLSDNPDS